MPAELHLCTLSCFAPTTGQNNAQIVLYTDGSMKIHGDAALARLRLHELLGKFIHRFPEPPERPQDVPVRPSGDCPSKRPSKRLP